MAIFKPYSKGIDYFFLGDAINEPATMYIDNIDVVVNKDVQNINLLINTTNFCKEDRTSNLSEISTPENSIINYPINDYLLGKSFLLNKDYKLIVLFCYQYNIPTVFINYDLFYSSDKMDKKIIKNLLNGIQSSIFEDITMVVFKYDLPLFKEVKTKSKNVFNINDNIHEFLNKLTKIE